MRTIRVRTALCAWTAPRFLLAVDFVLVLARHDQSQRKSPPMISPRIPRRVFLRQSIGFAALGGLVRAGETIAPKPADVSRELADVFGKTRIPGAATLVLQGDRIVAQGVCGVRKRGAKEPITLDDKFHLGSCTKAMTATLAGVFVDEGKLAWTTSIAELFPDVKDADPAWKEVTLRHVLAHRAGLPPNVPMLLAGALRLSTAPLPEQRRRIVADLLKRAPESEPGSKYLYANNGFTLVGAALEKISGRAWEELMRERLFAPLGMTSGGFGAPGSAGVIDQPRGHRGAELTPVEPGPNGDNIAAIGPAGTAHMTMGDWAKFATLHLRGDPANPRRAVKLLNADSFAQLHRPAEGETYVGGWGAVERKWANGGRKGDRGVCLTHAGSNTLWCCVVWLAPEIDFAALVACNAVGKGAAGPTCDAMVGRLIRAFAPKPGAAD